jgi:hypothetical protein
MSRETVDTMNPIGNAPATLDSINPIDPASNPGRAWTNIEGNTAAFNSLVQSASNEIFNPPAHLTDSALTPGGPFTPLDITAGPNQPTVDTAVRDYVGRFIDDVQSTPGLTVVKNGKAERAAFYDLGHAVRIDATSRIIFNPSGYPTTLEADEARNRLRSVVDAALSGSPRLRNYTDAQKQVYRNHYLTSFDARYPNSTEATQIRQQERLRNVDNELNDPELIGKITQSRENLAKLAVKDDERFWRFLGRRKIKKEERELRDSLNKFDTLLIEREVLTGNIDGSDADAIKARIAALKISHYSDNIKAIDRAQQLAESDPSSVHGWFTSKAIKFADWYREQSTAKKIMIGGAVAVSAVAMGFFTGPVGAGAVLAAGRIPQLNSFRGHSKRRSDKKNKRIFDNNIKYLDEGVKSLNLTEYGDISQASNILFQKQLEREFRATRRRVIGSVGMRAAVMAGTFVGGKMAAQFIEDHHLLDGVSRFFGDKWDVVVDKWHDVFGGDKVVTSSRFDPTTPGGSGSGSKLGSTMMDRAEHGLNPTSHEINEIVMKYDGSTVKYGSPDWQKLTQGLRSDHVNADDVAQIMEILPKNTVDPSTGDLMPLSGSQVKQQFGSITGSMNNQQLEAMGRFSTRIIRAWLKHTVKLQSIGYLAAWIVQLIQYTILLLIN